ncbi:protocadherin gamma-B4-like [Zonotrichia leucophrys gambelii]|uniref:protocadherin gamma-B4-like n=1 Tax=Zonotrichia leucophrys gambelii TaxID=257770 RepID=UPI00314033F9
MLPGPLERGRAAAAVSRRRLRVSLLAAGERRWSRRRRSVLPPQAARSPGAGRSGTDSSSGGGERRPERWQRQEAGARRAQRAENGGEAAAEAWAGRRASAAGRAAAAVWRVGRAAAERVRYAIPEELSRGSLVGPLARDLGLSADELPARKLRLSEEKQYFTVNEENGNLYVNERLDREEMCSESATCTVSFEALVQNPLNVFHVEVSIEDVNDNSPVFRKAVLELEFRMDVPGTRFPFEMARDADEEFNSSCPYQLPATHLSFLNENR